MVSVETMNIITHVPQEYAHTVPWQTKKPWKENTIKAFKISEVARPGFEPRHSEPKSDVLPLYYRAKYENKNYNWITWSCPTEMC